mmetsp:Transcript_25594/g.75652  ORF Transcript_25594/g.75652 Transcript_25594/m.75652 type:complete len:301 (+) Transcript_25594:1623-2525(+)|eukprot:190732-Chlamydomonas_euryale.AAC.11
MRVTEGEREGEATSTKQRKNPVVILSSSASQLLVMHRGRITHCLICICIPPDCMFFRPHPLRVRLRNQLWRLCITGHLDAILPNTRALCAHVQVAGVLQNKWCTVVHGMCCGRHMARLNFGIQSCCLAIVRVWTLWRVCSSALDRGCTQPACTTRLRHEQAHCVGHHLLAHGLLVFRQVARQRLAVLVHAWPERVHCASRTVRATRATPHLRRSVLQLVHHGSNVRCLIAQTRNRHQLRNTTRGTSSPCCSSGRLHSLSRHQPYVNVVPFVAAVAEPVLGIIKTGRRARVGQHLDSGDLV